MRTPTQSTFNELEKAHWFSKVGQRDTKLAVVLQSWSEAIENCSSNRSQDLLLEASNQYSEKLAARSRERFNQWNVVAGELKVVCEPLVMRKIQKVVQDHQLPIIFEHTVKWDILQLLMEAEFSDVLQPGFFAGKAYWYVHGHFPCGWKGGFPGGRPIIY